MEAGEGGELVPHSIEVAAKFRGPLPPPDLLRGYEETLPFSADCSFVRGQTEIRP